MPEKAKKFLITTESHERTVVKYLGRTVETVYCQTCARIVECLSIDQAAGLFEIKTKEILQLLNAEQIHEFETAEGGLYLCRHSAELAVSAMRT